MSTTKLVTVFGATGLQGGSVIRSLISNKDREFSVRGITRNPDSEKSKALAALGVEMVKAEGSNLEEIKQAFRGSWAVFLNTDTESADLNTPGGPTESDFGIALVDAAAEMGVQHLVYSGMRSATEATHGVLPVRVYDQKAAIAQYARNKGFKSAISVSAAWYMENHLNRPGAESFGGFPFFPDADGYLTLQLPSLGGAGNMSWVGIERDYGDIVHAALLEPETHDKKQIEAISCVASLEDLVATFEKVTKKKARYVGFDWETFETHGNLEADTIKGIFGLTHVMDAEFAKTFYDSSTAKALKAKAAAARGLTGEDAELQTIEGFITKHFGA
ncbi:hypothetical protein LMH87_000875 [Akanthomyces muscarius]|uniref:NmrA-like domain-containing protein n=1 Tax=Akanthomyces muscarius TaxID=2231603 RepID=A0A9W8QFE6_AKAMU|nr:hypothetical protein LMH87_000875 [Akanthomyces muscarius]KAJ4155639.1 hypothetical protein LMH87_000875 [Akanthomyces muscarius]